jgi:hypothetical protein
MSREFDSAVNEILCDPAASSWLKTAMRESLERDPVDALNDVQALARIFEIRLCEMFELADLDQCSGSPAQGQPLGRPKPPDPGFPG